MSHVYFSLGSNMGDTGANIDSALTLLSEKVHVQRRSSFYETEPVGYHDQNWFLNIAVEGDTDLTPEALLDFTQSIEQRMKRVKTIINGPRVIDVDILLYDTVQLHTERLTLPHPRMLERSFVLVPLCEIAPDLMLDGESIKNRVQSLHDAQVYKRA